MLYVEGSFFAPYNIDDVSIDNLTAFDDNAGKRKEEGKIMVSMNAFVKGSSKN